MNKHKKLPILLVGVISLLTVTITLSMGVSIALYEKYANGNGTYGEISLRSYYECGSGRPPKTLGQDDPGDPYVITRPRHLYNLSRLQGLGVYGDKTYFQLGKVDLGGVDSNGVPMCYADDSSSTKVPYLDMSDSDQENNPINAIGSEALPFYGIFDGQNVEIKNLNVYANPQDAGLFGYTAHGSEIYNLFLSDVTIHALGYTSDYANLYGPLSDAGEGAYFDYDPNDESAHTNFVSGYANTIYTYFYADENFEYTSTGSSNIPSVSIVAPSNAFTYSSLLSGDLIKFENGAIVPDLVRLFEFFAEKKEEENIKYPIQASSSGSLIASSVDRYGQKHSKVILTLEFDFTLDSAEADFISMGVHLSSDHGNNIGLIAGHCDGSVFDCYVFNGSFVMNNGGNSYSKLPNGSNLGLIGLVGGTVQNILATESDVGAKEGKNIGVLDFTTIYNDVINASSFSNSQSAPSVTTPPVAAGVTFNPVSTSQYKQYLRNFNGYYITDKVNSVSFKGRTILTNTDLGVFTVATDPNTSDGVYSGDFLEKSVVYTEDLAVGGDYYIYYSTGEYNKTYQTDHGGSTFANYLSSYDTYNSDYMLLGYTFPNKDQVTRDSFKAREARQNYFVRFKLDPTYRRGKGFYFSDLDTDTDGGAFLANYFNYKLVDQNSFHIPVGDNKCGVMLRNNLRQEIGSFSASFGLPDLATKDGGGTSTRKAYCLEDGEGKRYVGNMINFEIKNALANVTVIAAPSDSSKPSALGVYKLDNGDFSGAIVGDDYGLTFDQTWNDPDYAFFMPTDNHLAYYDYRVNNTTQKGEIGTYSSNGTFTANAKNPTVVKNYGYNSATEHGFSSTKTRLFAHTFCLPRGRYCIGSAANANQCVPKVFYLCAQGQDDGQFDFDDTVFASTDRVENVDFLNVPRFDENGQENIDVVSETTAYNPSSDELVNHRLYLALTNSERSRFSDSIPIKISFIYDSVSGKFIISAYTYDAVNDRFIALAGQDLIDAVQYISVDNYNHSLTGPAKQLTVSLFGDESSGEILVFPTVD